MSLPRAVGRLRVARSLLASSCGAIFFRPSCLPCSSHRRGVDSAESVVLCSLLLSVCSVCQGEVRAGSGRVRKGPGMVRKGRVGQGQERSGSGEERSGQGQGKARARAAGALSKLRWSLFSTANEARAAAGFAVRWLGSFAALVVVHCVSCTGLLRPGLWTRQGLASPPPSDHLGRRAAAGVQLPAVSRFA